MIAVYRPGTQLLYHCTVDDFTVDHDAATETNPGIVRLATVEEVVQATSNTLAISPVNLQKGLLSSEYIFDGNSGAGDDDYEESTAFTVNPATTPDASETVAGIVRLATAEETIDGRNDAIAVTPFGLKSMLDSPSYIADAGVKQIDENNFDYIGEP